MHKIIGSIAIGFNKPVKLGDIQQALEGLKMVDVSPIFAFTHFFILGNWNSVKFSGRSC